MIVYVLLYQVTDEQGRRRFHGAFSGGFSAGYFNSVGSKEGWQPSAFTSSRDRRNAGPSSPDNGSASSRAYAQRAEDFMDEEDDPLLGKRLETTAQYDTLQSTLKGQLREQQQGSGGHPQRQQPIPAFALPEDLLLPPSESVGAKLLNRMGWKDGQGIGPRIRKRKFEPQSESKQQQEEEEETKEEIYVAPRVSIDRSVFPEPKNDRYGAGFDPYANAPEFARYKMQHQQSAQQAQQGKREIVSFADALKADSNGDRRAVLGYGLSALEENDDLDVYGTTSMSEFDTEIAPIGKRGANIKRVDSAAQESKQPSRRNPTVCSDGKAPLPGFELAPSREKPPKSVLLRLEVPAGFKPVHRFKSSDGTNDSVASLYRLHNFSTSKHGQGSLMTAKQRGAMLGEEPEQEAPSAKSSVFDLMDPAQRQKLFGAVAQAKQGAVAQPQVPKERQPLVQGGEVLRATITASIANRFVSAKEESSDAATAEVAAAPMIKKSYRTECMWMPSSLLCKRFHVKCKSATTTSAPMDASSADKRDLFDREITPHLIAAYSSAKSATSGSGAATRTELSVKTNAQEEEELPPLPIVQKPAASLLQSIFEPSDEEESDGDESSSDDSSSDEGEAKAPSTRSTEPQKFTALAALSTTDQPSIQDLSNGNLPVVPARVHSGWRSEDSSSSSDSEQDGPSRSSARKSKKRRREHDDDSDADSRRKKDRKKHKKKKAHKKHRSSSSSDAKHAKASKKSSHKSKSRYKDSRRDRSRSPRRSR